MPQTVDSVLLYMQTTLQEKYAERALFSSWQGLLLSVIDKFRQKL